MSIALPGRRESRMRGRLRAAALALLGCVMAAAAPAPAVAERVIHVDFEAGDDAHDGLTRDAPRRTVPAPEAIRPGDRILFKGGVRYRPAVRIETGGAADAPVVYDGNSDGAWGEGRAIIDGSVDLGPWTRVGETAEGLAIWETDKPDWIGRHDMIVFQDGRRARLASSADLSDNWVLPEWGVYFEVPREQVGEATLTDPAVLSRFSNAWQGASIRLHYGNNQLDAFPIHGVDRETGTLRFAKAPVLRRGNVKYAILNHPDVFDAPGEFLVRGAEGRLRYIPFDAADPNAVEMRMAARAFGFVNAASHHVTIRGFHITGQRQFAVAAGNKRNRVEVRGLRVEDNVIERGGQIIVANQRDFAIVGNRISEVVPTRPIHVIRSVAGRIEGNVLRRTQSGITAYGAADSLFKENDVRGILGVHGNAMTIYVESHNTRIIGNRLQGHRGLTVRDSDGLIVAFNRIHGHRFSFAQWAPVHGGVAMGIVNNTLAGAVLIQTGSARKSIFRNNAVTRMAMKAPESLKQRTHNLYGNFSHRTVTRENFRDGEVHLPLREAVAGVGRLEMTPTEAGRRLLSRGAPLDVLGVEVSHIGAVGLDGRMPDLSGIGLPPPRAEAGE